jgi:hypothetical protein
MCQFSFQHCVWSSRSPRAAFAAAICRKHATVPPFSVSHREPVRRTITTNVGEKGSRVSDRTPRAGPRIRPTTRPRDDRRLSGLRLVLPPPRDCRRGDQNRRWRKKFEGPSACRRGAARGGHGSRMTLRCREVPTAASSRHSNRRGVPGVMTTESPPKQTDRVKAVRMPRLTLA